MLLRIVIFGIDHSINVRFIKANTGSNWFSFRGRSYRLERETVRQVIGDDGKLTATVEALYVEGNPLPIGSKRKPEDVTLEHLDELVSLAANRVRKQKFMLFRRS